MIKKGIDRTFSEAMYPINTLKMIQDAMEKEAIKDDGIYSTFKYHYHRISVNLTQTTLHYYKFDGDGCSWIPMQKKILYKTCPELGDVRLTLPYICSETLQKVADRIKLDVAKNDNAIWSTIKVEPWTDHFTVSYEKVYVDGAPSEDPHLTTSRYLGASDLEIENTKKTLRRIQENSYYGLYPRRSGLTYAASTYAFDEKSKQDMEKVLKMWKAKADLDIYSPSKEFLNRVYGSHNKEEKEKKDMNITLMVVPEGMSKEFVNKVKANYQSNNSLRLFIASTDIDYGCEHEPIKTKYDLFENWVKTGKVDIVYFMLGFDVDPDVKAFEAFVRGITEANVPGKIDVRVVYQKDDICNDTSRLRSVYFDEAEAQEDLERTGNKVVKEAKRMKEVYSLDDEGLEAIKYSKGRIEISEGLIMDKIMDAAFASDEDAKPAKKGGKK